MSSNLAAKLNKQPFKPAHVFNGEESKLTEPKRPEYSQYLSPQPYKSKEDQKSTTKKETVYQTPSRAAEYRTVQPTYQQPVAKDEGQHRFKKLKQISEEHYQNEIARLKSQCIHLEVKNKMLTRDNSQQEQEITFLKKRLNQVESSSQLASEAKPEPGKFDLLQSENQKLKQDISSKLSELQGMRAQMSSLEFQDQLSAQANQYESRINYLKKELDEAQTEIRKLKVVIKDKQILEKEVEELRELLKYKINQAEQLKQQKQETLLDNYKLKQAELMLREKEQIHEEAIHSLKQSLIYTERDKQKQLQMREHLFSDIEKQLKTSLGQQLQQKEAELEQIESHLVRSEEKNEHMLNHVAQLEEQKKELLLSEEKAKYEAYIWKERSKSAEKEKEEEVNKERLERYRSIQSMKQTYDSELHQYRSKVQDLHQKMTKKDQEIQQSNQLIDLQRRKNELIKHENHQLEKSLDDLQDKCQRVQQSYRENLGIKEQIFNRSLEKERQLHQQSVSELKQENYKLSGLVQESKSEIEKKQIEQLRLRRQKLEAMESAELLKIRLKDQERINKFQSQIHQEQLQRVERSLSDEVEKKKTEAEFYKRSALKKELELAREQAEQDRLKQQLNTIERAKDRELRQHKMRASDEIEYLNRSIDKQKREYQEEITNLDYKFKLKSQEADGLRQSCKKLYQKAQYM